MTPVSTGATMDPGKAQAGDFRRLQVGGINRLGTKYGGAYDDLAGVDKPRLDAARISTDNSLDTITGLYKTSLGDQSTFAPAVRRANTARLQSEGMKSQINANAVANGGTLDDTFLRGEIGAAEGAYNAQAADAFADAADNRDQKRIQLAQALYQLQALREAQVRGDYTGDIGAGANIEGQQIAGFGGIASQLQASEEQRRQQQAAQLQALIQGAAQYASAGR